MEALLSMTLWTLLIQQFFLNRGDLYEKNRHRGHLRCVKMTHLTGNALFQWPTKKHKKSFCKMDWKRFVQQLSCFLDEVKVFLCTSANTSPLNIIKKDRYICLDHPHKKGLMMRL